jgi:hypothetical protein
MVDSLRVQMCQASGDLIRLDIDFNKAFSRERRGYIQSPRVASWGCTVCDSAHIDGESGNPPMKRRVQDEDHKRRLRKARCANDSAAIMPSIRGEVATAVLSKMAAS